MSLKDAAQHLAAHGRNNDTMLVHMSPREVHGLQQLAQARGTSLTVNPHTGLPEALSLDDVGDFVEKAAPVAAMIFAPELAAAYGMESAAAAAALTAGGASYLMTGDLNKGLQAGLLAYGGTGLSEAASQGIQGAEAAAAQNAAATANEIGAAEAAKIAPAELTSGEAFKAGVKGISALGPKDLAKYGGAALIGSGALDPDKPSMPTGSGAGEGYIRPKYYDYRTQTYYDLPAVKASEWGSRNIDDYVNSMVAKPVTAANGGLMDAARYAEGGDTPIQPKSVNDLYEQILGRAPDTGGAQYWSQQFGDSLDANEIAAFKNAAQAELANRTPEERAALAPNLVGANNAYFQANKDVADAYAKNNNGMSPEQFAAYHYTNYGQKEGRDSPVLEAQYSNPYLLANQDVAKEYAANTYGMTPQQIADYHYNTYGKKEQRADQATDASNQIANLYRMALGRDPDPAGLKYWTDRWNKGDNEQDLYKDMLYAAKQNTELGNQNMTLAEANKLYSGYKSVDPNTNADEWVRNVLGREITAADRQTDWYKQATDASKNADVAAAKGIYNSFLGYAKAEGATTAAQKMALAREVISQKGLTDEDVYSQTGKSIEQLIGKPKTDLDIWHASQLLAPSNSEFDFSSLKGRTKTTPQTNAPTGTTNPYGNTTNPGDITKNADKTTTVTPNLPGRPYGGYTGMDQVKGAYVQGGGSLGQTLRPTQSYQNTGLSAAAYDYLGGKGAWPTATQNLPAYKDTPSTDTTSKYIWKDNVMILNPNYKDPTKVTAPATTPVTEEATTGYAKGGIAHFDAGGYTSYTPEQITSYFAANPTADVAAATKQFNADPLAVLAARSSAASSAPAASTGIAAAAPAATPAAAPTYTQYTNDQMANYFAKNPDVNVADAVKQFNANPAAVNNYITSLIGQYKDPTTTANGTGYLGAYQNLIKEGMTPAEFAAAAQGVNKDWGKGDLYWNPTTVAHAYDVADKILKFDPQTDLVTPSDKEWVAMMDANKFSVDDIARATGLNANEVQRRYNAAKIQPVTVTPTGNYGSGPSTGTSASGKTVSTATPGDITRNVDGTATVTPNVPGRPTGGFTGVGAVKDAYTAGGGSLGQTLAPSTTYQNTGLSAAAYDYLNGKGAWPTNPQKQAVYADTPANTKDMYIWKNNMLVLNPDYVDPAKAAAKPATTTEAPVAKAGGLMGYADGGISVGSRYDPNIDGSSQDSPYASFQPTVGHFAAGGEAHYNLGSYSDGGRLLRGPGDGVSDSIPATIGRGQPARLADGEFVIPARIVSEIGNGSTEAGARKLYAMMDRVQAARRQTVGKGKIAKNTRADKYLPK